MTTTISEVVNIEDAIITLNSNETSAASVNAGMEIERGTDTNVQFRWNETGLNSGTGQWEAENFDSDNTSKVTTVLATVQQIAVGTDLVGDTPATTNMGNGLGSILMNTNRSNEPWIRIS